MVQDMIVDSAADQAPKADSTASAGYRILLKFSDRGQTASPVTLKGYFEQDKDLTDVGGAGYLADLAAGVMSIINTADYAKTIYDLFLRRELILLGEEVVNDAYEQTLERDAQNTIELAESKLFSLAESGEVKGGFVTLRDSVLIAIEHAEKAYKADGNVTGVTTGLIDMDKKLGGLQNSDLLILAGRPSMGKTALAVNIAFNAALAYAESGGTQGGRAAFFSLEMAADQLAGRILAEQSGVSGDSIRKGAIRQDVNPKAAVYKRSLKLRVGLRPSQKNCKFPCLHFRSYRVPLNSAKINALSFLTYVNLDRLSKMRMW